VKRLGDSIYTIPVNESFEEKDGCPLCRIERILEERCLDYITGAAMMEPDVRIKTNEEGFCPAHFHKMAERRKALQVALILESHLKHLRDEVLPASGARSFADKKGRPAPSMKLEQSCYVCGKINWALGTMVDTIMRLWTRDEAFVTLYKEQPFICLPHYNLLMAGGAAHLRKDAFQSFEKATLQLAKNYLDQLCADVSHYVTMYDYRNAGDKADWGTAKGSPQRAVDYLSKRMTGE